MKKLNFSKKHYGIFTLTATLLTSSALTVALLTSSNAEACDKVKSGDATITVTCDNSPNYKCRILINGKLHKECQGIADTKIN